MAKYFENDEDVEWKLKKLLDTPIGIDKFFQHKLGQFWDTNEDLEDEDFLSLTEIL